MHNEGKKICLCLYYSLRPTVKHILVFVHNDDINWWKARELLSLVHWLRWETMQIKPRSSTAQKEKLDETEWESVFCTDKRQKEKRAGASGCVHEQFCLHLECAERCVCAVCLIWRRGANEGVGAQWIQSGCRLRQSSIRRSVIETQEEGSSSCRSSSSPSLGPSPVLAFLKEKGKEGSAVVIIPSRTGKFLKS